MSVIDILADHPAKETFDLAELNRAIQALLECSVSCAACADSELARGGLDMQRCISLCLHCSDVCGVTAKVLARPTPAGHSWERLVSAAAAMCAECARECSSHDHLCCQSCAEACRSAEQACQQLLAAAQTGA